VAAASTGAAAIPAPAHGSSAAGSTEHHEVTCHKDRGIGSRSITRCNRSIIACIMQASCFKVS
jgi:hypothetical protein